MVSAQSAGRDLATLSVESPWYAEDLMVGDWMNLGTVSVDRDEIIEFASRYDPLPIHLDGTGSPFADVIASGIHTMALYSSLASPRFVSRLALVAGKGIERLRLPSPVLPGMTLRGSATIEKVVLRPARADVHYLSTMADDQDNVVLSFIGITVLARRRSEKLSSPSVEHRPA